MLGAISWGTFLGYLFVGLLVYYGYVCWKYGLLREWLTGRKRLANGDGDPGARSGIGGDGPPGGAGGTPQGGAIGEAGELAGSGSSGSAPSGLAADGSIAAGSMDGAQRQETSTVAAAGSGGAGGTSVYPVGKQMPLGLVEFRDGETAEGAGQEGAGPGLAAISDADAELFAIAENLIGQLQSLIQEAAATQLARPELERRIGGLLTANRRLIGTSCQASIEGFLERSSRMQLRYALVQTDIQRLWGIGVELPDGLAMKASAVTGTAATGTGSAEDDKIKSTLKQGI